MIKKIRDNIDIIATPTISFLIGMMIGIIGCMIIDSYKIETVEITENKSFSWIESYDETADNLDLFKVYNTADLTEEILMNRNGDIIIEKVYGIVVDAEGNGRILDSEEDFINAHRRDYDSIEYDNYYISYRSTKGAKEGDIVLSYMIYNPDSNYTDDIMERFDYIMDNVND